jgi:aryl-alcohol dehydrogenase-like predicted oxidoreductase
MKYIKMGSKGPQVSTIGFGAWAIGGMNWGKTSDDESMAALHKAIDLGVTFIDTADVYGFGHSEELIAELIKQRGKDNIVVATKAGNDFYYASSEHDHGYGPIKQNYQKEYLIEAAEKSLDRLKLETLDILQLHSPDLELLEQDEPWLAMEQLKREGKIQYVGLSVQSFKENEQAHLLDEHADILDCIQVRYNLLERQAEESLFPKAIEHGIGIIVRIPLLFGFLTGKFKPDTVFSPDDHRAMNLSPEKLDLYIKQLQAIQPVFDACPDQSMAQVSLRFCLSHPACHTAIPGGKTAEQVTMNCLASDAGPLSPEQLALLK